MMEATWLQWIWFVLWGVLWAVYFLLDGFDLGLGTLLPFLSKGEAERRMVLNAMGPFWDGNEVWLITAGGVTFAAFPLVYAVMFSTLYTPLMLILFALILRGISFEFRSKEESVWWRKLWDTCLFLGSLLPAVLFGVAFANIFQGLPIRQVVEETGCRYWAFEGNLFSLLNPYGLLGGLLFLLLFLVHGALWAAAKTNGDLQHRAARIAPILWVGEVIVAVAFLVISWWSTSLWKNYLKYPLLWILPLAAVIGLLAVPVFLRRKAWFWAWGANGLAIVGAVLWGVAGLWPNLLPSRIDPNASLTVAASSSSPLTLKIMLVVALVFVPLVIAYQTWVYVKFSHKVTPEILQEPETY